ncbi:RNA-directed DNA polymerase from mobile element jockey [Trichonephila clavipes]|nr:RNA-directed DNA polymerase from mobile element jockey [Trichonephila clavipes]
MLRTIPFGELRKRSGRKPPRSPPLTAPLVLLSAIQTKPNQTQRSSRKRKYPDSGAARGFRPRLSTSHQLLRVVKFIKEGNNKDECTAAVFLDIQKAFDRVWHTGLLFKLITYKIQPPLIFLINSYVSDRSFTVKINRTFSQLKKINAGVAQGSILAPTLFNLYVNDIIKNTNTITCMYADDTAILSRHRNLDTLVENINEHLAHLETWFSVWKIALNSSKTEEVFFSKRKPPPEITLQNQRIPWSQHTKYLGVIVDKNFTFRQHITHIRDKFKDTTCKLYSLICRKSKLSRHNKLLIYTLIIKPLLTYASPVWGHAAKTNINSLETSQNLIIWQICNAHWYMRNKDLRIACNIPTIRQTIQGWEKKINHDVKVEQIKKTPTKNGREDVPQSTKRSNEAECRRGEGKNAGRKTGRLMAENQDCETSPQNTE